MSETAILVVGSHSLFAATSKSWWESQPEAPIACLEILGASLLERTAERLERSGVRRIWVVAEDRLVRFIPWHLKRHIARVTGSSDEASVIEGLSRKEAGRGAETILLIGLGPYAEFDPTDILRFHRASGARATVVSDQNGVLPFWVFRAGDPARPADFNGGAATYSLNGYSNPLADPSQLRGLITDAFEGRCALRPRGREVERGIWVGEGARIHRAAQLIAPVYIGMKARLHASAVVGQYSNVECASVVGCGSLVERSSIFERTHLGKGLDVFDAVIDGSRLASLPRNLAFEINDPTILAKIEPWRLVRFSRRPGRRAAAGEVVSVTPALNPAPVPVYVDSRKERHGQWEACNREAIT